MRSKLKKFYKLPTALIVNNAQNLSNRELVNLAQTSKYHLAFFKPVIDVRKLLHHVTRGEHDRVKAMLKKDISLIFKRGFVTDCSEREFENISGFEYALWALDKHMWAAMIECIPNDENGKEVLEQLYAQYNKVSTDGVTYRFRGRIIFKPYVDGVFERLYAEYIDVVTYRLGWRTITEQHFDFKNTIIKELQKQVDSTTAPGEKNWDAIDDQWQIGVGGAQKQLPMHIVDEYCSNVSFLDPEFTSQPKSLKQFYNWTTRKYENWFSVDSGLSFYFAIHKGLRSTANGTRHPDSKLQRLAGKRFPMLGEHASADLKAMTELCNVRTKDFIDLKSQLEGQMTLDNYQVSQI